MELKLKPDYFLNKIIQNNLNKRLHKIYEEFEGEDIDLLDKLIFDNLDYVDQFMTGDFKILCFDDANGMLWIFLESWTISMRVYCNRSNEIARR